MFESKARGGEVESTEFVLTREDWSTSKSLYLETERLVIEPFSATDALDLASLMNDRDIARMMQTLPHPFSVDQAAQWIADHPFDRSTGFVAKIIMKDGTLTGFLCLGVVTVKTSQ